MRQILIVGSLPLSPSALSPRAKDIYDRVCKFIKEEVAPIEGDVVKWAFDPQNKWKIPPILEEKKV